MQILFKRLCGTQYFDNLNAFIIVQLMETVMTGDVIVSIYFHINYIIQH